MMHRCGGLSRLIIDASHVCKPDMYESCSSPFAPLYTPASTTKRPPWWKPGQYLAFVTTQATVQTIRSMCFLMIQLDTAS